MRKFALILVVALLTALTLTPLVAQDTQPDVFALANLTPIDTDVYMSIRIDDNYLASLNDLVTLVTDAAKEAGAPVESIPRLQDLIATYFDPDATPEQADAVLAWMGDTLTLNAIVTNGQNTFTAFLPITDRQAALTAITATDAGLVESETVGAFTIYQANTASPTRLLLADDLLILTSADANLLASGDYAKLSDLPAFSQLVEALPADGYDLAAYVSAASVAESVEMNSGISGDVLLAGTIRDDKTLIIDMMVAPTTPAQSSPAVDPAFLRYVPADSTAVVHATDLSNLLNGIILLAEAQGDASARAEFEQGLMSLGLSLDDLLTWTKGDYALFGRVDLQSLLQAFIGQQADAMVMAINVGLVIEATDAALAKQFSDKIAQVVESIIANQPGVSFSTVDIHGTDVTRIDIILPVGGGQSIPIALGLGANADVFVFGTFNAVESVLTDSSGLARNTLYAEGARYLLPDPTSVWYAEGGTLMTLGALGVTIIAIPAASAVSEIEQEFKFGRETAAHAQTIQTQADIVIVMRMIERFSEVVRFATMSSTITPNGAYVLRATLTLGE